MTQQERNKIMAAIDRGCNNLCPAYVAGTCNVGWHDKPIKCYRVALALDNADETPTFTRD